MSTIRGYVQGALRNKELKTSFIEHFKENPENAIRLRFQFHIPNLSQERCFMFSLLYGTM